MAAPAKTVTEADHAYVSQHHATITAWFAEAMATVVDTKPGDPVAFLRAHLARQALQEQDDLHSIALEELRLTLESEKGASQHATQQLAMLQAQYSPKAVEAACQARMATSEREWRKKLDEAVRTSRQLKAKLDAYTAAQDERQRTVSQLAARICELRAEHMM